MAPMLRAALNGGVFFGWLVVFVAAAVKLMHTSGAALATPAVWSMPVSGLALGLEMLCCAEVARLLAGHIRGTPLMRTSIAAGMSLGTADAAAIVGLPHHLSGRNLLTRLFHTRLIVCLAIFPLLLDRTLTSVVLLAWSSTELARYPLHIVPDSRLARLSFACYPLLGFPLCLLGEIALCYEVLFRSAEVLDPAALPNDQVDFRVDVLGYIVDVYKILACYQVVRSPTPR